MAQEEARPGPYAPQRDLPRTLAEGNPAQVPVFVGDALDAGRRDGELQQVTLGLRIVGACPEDRYSFRLNDSELAREDAKISTFYGGIVVYFPVKVGMPQRIETHHWFEFDLPIGLLQASSTVKNPHVSNAERCSSSIDSAFSLCVGHLHQFLHRA